MRSRTIKRLRKIMLMNVPPNSLKQRLGGYFNVLEMFPYASRGVLVAGVKVDHLGLNIMDLEIRQQLAVFFLLK